MDIEEISRLKNAFYDNVLEDPAIMKQKIIDMEAERRNIVINLNNMLIISSEIWCAKLWEIT